MQRHVLFVSAVGYQVQAYLKSINFLFLNADQDFQAVTMFWSVLQATLNPPEVTRLCLPAQIGLFFKVHVLLNM